MNIIAPHGYYGEECNACIIIGEHGEIIYEIHRCPHCGVISTDENICLKCGKQREKIVTDKRPKRMESKTFSREK